MTKLQQQQQRVSGPEQQLCVAAALPVNLTGSEPRIEKHENGFVATATRGIVSLLVGDSLEILSNMWTTDKESYWIECQQAAATIQWDFQLTWGAKR